MGLIVFVFSDGNSTNGETIKPSGENVAPSNHVVNKNRIPPGTYEHNSITHAVMLTLPSVDLLMISNINFRWLLFWFVVIIGIAFELSFFSSSFFLQYQKKIYDVRRKFNHRNFSFYATFTRNFQ